MIVWTNRLPFPISLYCLFAVHSFFAKLMAKDKGTQYNSLFTLSILCLLDWPGDTKLKMHISKQYDPRSAVLPAQDFRDK